MKWAAVTLGGLGLAGCGGGADGLRAFDGSVVKVLMSNDPDKGSLSLSVEVTNYGCPSMGGTKAFINGQEMELSNPGGRNPGLLPALSGDCHRPKFSIAKTPRELGLEQEISRFELIDGDVHRVIEGRWLLAPRELKWRSPEGARPLQPGEEVRLEAIGPAGDVLIDEDHWAYANFQSKEPYGEGWSIDLKKAAGEERILSGTAPAFARAMPGRFTADVLSRAEVLRCDEMEDCRILVSYRMEQDLPGAP